MAKSKKREEEEFVAPDLTPFVEAVTALVNGLVKVMKVIIEGIADIITFTYKTVKGENKNENNKNPKQTRRRTNN